MQASPNALIVKKCMDAGCGAAEVAAILDAGKMLTEILATRDVSGRAEGIADQIAIIVRLLRHARERHRPLH